MARVYSHGSEHIYEDRGRRLVLRIPANGWCDIPDDIASLIVSATPQKLCDVSIEDDPDKHRCRLSKAGYDEARAAKAGEKAEAEAAAVFAHDDSATTRIRKRALAKRLGRNPTVAA